MKSTTFQRNAFFILTCLLISLCGNAQLLDGKRQKYTKADTLRGSLRPERTNFDMLKYNLNLKVEPDKKYISGYNKITFEVLESGKKMQLDLFENMQIDSIIYKNDALKYTREANAVFIHFPKELKKGKKESLTFYYSGNPTIARTPPWDGGFIFTKDKNNKDWVSVAVQGTGASLWYPNKDHQSDEPEEAEIHIAAPNGLMNVSNGRLTGKKDLKNGFTQWSWKVTNTINNYNIIINIGDYVHIEDEYKDLDLDYYVLSYNKEKAIKHFAEVKPMMDCFYEKFGTYPFEEDSFKLVETPYLGMEHQSAVAYGNQYVNGYLGNDLSKTGVGLRWDFITIHESAHEWFGNSITASDIADMWIHEGFTSYAEAVYIECRWGKEDALTYLYGLRNSIGNQEPIIGDYGVNSEGSADMYHKGANMINTIRSVINDDEKWWKLLKDFSLTFKHQITTSEEVIAFFEENTKENLTPIFKQYLYFSKLPELEIKKEDNVVYYRWKANAENFNMPLNVLINGKETRIFPTPDWKSFDNGIDKKNIKVNEREFYINHPF
ncbi:M1 family metallopeptidase [Mesonia sp. K7]|uniref:M1 family metallopeptidase n=1 Tax=Mesonia sp. K7 TaxID=2218606 RepID=UPI000DAA46A1|nr:M1 family metallopeptidase [Mesonia sp. K7]PZD77255.1 M1 family peptidase [Mesonia sp. K7]